jgi:hypothetical protein
MLQCGMVLAHCPAPPTTQLMSCGTRRTSKGPIIMFTPIKNMPRRSENFARGCEILKGVTTSMILALLAIGLSGFQQVKPYSRQTRQVDRNPAEAFGPLANLPASTNIAGILQTFQTPSSLLPIADTVSQLQARMKASIPAGIPEWDGYGPLPGAIGSAEFNPIMPSFNFESSCSTVPMTFYSVFSSSYSLPTVWCGAVSDQKKPAQADSDVESPTAVPRSVKFSLSSVGSAR